MTAPPIPCVWTGAAFEPLSHVRRVAAHHYGPGEVVSLIAHEERSEKSHRHEFAWLKEAWQNLPEHLADEFPSTEHLRKWALIKAGFYDEQRIDVGTNAGALRVAGAIRSFPGEEFSAVVVRGPLVVVRRPKSQSRRAMAKDEFQASKTGVMEAVAELIGVQPATLGRAA